MFTLGQIKSNQIKSKVLFKVGTFTNSTNMSFLNRHTF